MPFGAGTQSLALGGGSQQPALGGGSPPMSSGASSPDSSRIGIVQHALPSAEPKSGGNAATPTPKPTVLTTPPAIVARDHTQGAEFWNDSAAAIDSTYGFHNWRAAAPYIDVFFEPGGPIYNQAVRSAGIKTGMYVDPNLCSGSYPVGANPNAGPDCSVLADDAFYFEDGSPGLPLTVSYNGTQLQKWGNPASSSLQAGTLAWAKKLDLSDGGYDVILVDDAATPDEWYRAYWCWGAGTFGGGNYTCSGAPAAPPFNSVYSRSQWQTGEAALAAALPQPVIFNGLGSHASGESEAAIASVAATGPNAWGGMCETCFYANAGNANNPFLWTGPILDGELTGLMHVMNAKRNAMVVNDDVTDPVARQRALADMMLVYDPDHLFISGRPCGQVSHIHACPEQGLTFYAPRRPYPTRLSALTSSTGIYAREFEACYNRGQFVGPCAAVVNPDVYGSHPLPSLRYPYRHTLVINGTGPCSCYGDSGSVSFDGPMPPTPLAKATAYVLFP